MLRFARSALPALSLFASGARVPDERAQSDVQRYAVLVGVSEYPDPVQSLNGASLNDVALMRDLLVRRLGFSDSNIVTLVDRQVTRDSAIATVRAHLGRAGPNDVALLYFSGHGIQLDMSLKPASAVNNAEPDKLDEALLVWDRVGERVTYLLDDEVGLLLDELRSRRTIAIIDACHSGTATRALLDDDVPLSSLGTGSLPVLPYRGGDRSAAFVARRVLRDEVREIIAKPETLLTAGHHPERRPHLLLSAAGDSETALAGPLRMPDGTSRPLGVFTAALYLSVRAAPGSAPITDIISSVRRAVAPVARKIQGTPQTPRASGSWQWETLERVFRTVR